MAEAPQRRTKASFWVSFQDFLAPALLNGQLVHVVPDVLRLHQVWVRVLHVNAEVNHTPDVPDFRLLEEFL